MGHTQGDRQASVRSVTGTALTYEGDWHALFTQAGIPLGDFNGRMLAWINGRLGANYKDINGAMAAFAANQGVPSWGAMGAFDAAGAPTAPVNTTAPAIYGSPYVGSTLTADRGLWTGSPAPTFAYQWKSGATNVGTNANTYTPVSGDIGNTITVTVTATNGSGSASATSAGTVAITAAPVAPAFTANPSISGTASVGATLTGSDGTITGNPTPSVSARVWKANGTQVGTGSTYVVQSGDVGATITFSVTATNTAGTTTGTSSGVTASSATPIDVAIFMGQSNATGSQTDYTVPAYYNVSSNVYAFDGTNIVDYVPRTVVGLNAGSPSMAWAADLQYVYNYHTAYPGSKLCVLRYTADGSNLATQWLNSGGLLSTATTFFTNAMAALVAAGYAPTIRIVDWMQGESDSVGATDAGNYQTNLASLVATLRDPSGAWNMPSSAPFAIGRISNSSLWTYRSTVRTAEANIAAADVGGPQWLYDTDDLPRESDNAHYTNAGQLTRGDRVWAVDQGTYVFPVDTTPDAFSFTDVTGATLSTDYTSNTVAVAGIDSPAAISITGGLYSKNGGAFTSSAGTVVNGDTVAVKVTSSGSNSTAVSATLTIGGVSDTYSVTTLASGPSATTLSTTPNYGSTGTFSNGNLTFACSGGNVARSVAAIPSGSYYFEMTLDSISSDFAMVGVCGASGAAEIGFDSTNHSVGYFDNGAVFKDAGYAGDGGHVDNRSYGAGATVGVEVVNNGDGTGYVVFIGPDGLTDGTQFSISSLLALGSIYAGVGCFSGGPIQATMNFGATSYVHGLPSGFSSIPG